MQIRRMLPSPILGMDQNTTDLANRMVHAGHDEYLVTTPRVSRDRYVSIVTTHTPEEANNSEFSAQAPNLHEAHRTLLVKTAAVMPSLKGR